MFCPKCKSSHSVKNGHHHGKQRYKCRACNCQFTKEQPRGKNTKTKHWAILLYVNGLSFRAIAKLVGVSHKAVYDWVRAFGLATYEKPIPQGEIVVELDELWHFLKFKKTSSGSGKPIAALLNSSLIGNAETGTVKP
ncbi:IS1 family transposase [Candidatus Bathycorpusculum sp.]|uniref:IS1 family transposase n=1 Tax=Candidatus Bathycorpusculum sp. TaxID=2994959 RepID=UPI002837D3A2|nr:IS1 family transposase [Candidatus Termitimicrobium sp.]